ncbi:MAG: hypothetical protein ACFB0B_14390 [Thermonemataceae bacterium]
MKFPRIRHVSNSLLRPNIWRNLKQKSYLNGFQRALLALAEVDSNNK